MGNSHICSFLCVVVGKSVLETGIHTKREAEIETERERETGMVGIIRCFVISHVMLIWIMFHAVDPK